MNTKNQDIIEAPDIEISVEKTFGFESKLKVPAYSQRNEYVPEID